MEQENSEQEFQIWVKGFGSHHLSEDGKKTFCGKQIERPRWVKCPPDETLDGFIKNCKPRCLSCRKSANIILVIEKIANSLSGEDE